MIAYYLQFISLPPGESGSQLRATAMLCSCWIAQTSEIKSGWLQHFQANIYRGRMVFAIFHYSSFSDKYAIHRFWWLHLVRDGKDKVPEEKCLPYLVHGEL